MHRLACATDGGAGGAVSATPTPLRSAPCRSRPQPPAPRSRSAFRRAASTPSTGRTGFPRVDAVGMAASSSRWPRSAVLPPESSSRALAARSRCPAQPRAGRLEIVLRESWRLGNCDAPGRQPPAVHGRYHSGCPGPVVYALGRLRRRRRKPARAHCVARSRELYPRSRGADPQVREVAQGSPRRPLHAPRAWLPMPISRCGSTRSRRSVYDGLDASCRSSTAPNVQVAEAMGNLGGAEAARVLPGSRREGNLRGPARRSWHSATRRQRRF